MLGSHARYSDSVFPAGKVCVTRTEWKASSTEYSKKWSSYICSSKPISGWTPLLQGISVLPINYQAAKRQHTQRPAVNEWEESLKNLSATWSTSFHTWVAQYYASPWYKVMEKGITKSDTQNHLSERKQLSLDRLQARLQKLSAFTEVIEYKARTLAMSNIDVLCE